MDETFLYFGFGSNLLRGRILISNRSAVFKTIARLDGYELGFSTISDDSHWHGAAATIKERADSHVWGVVWCMNKSDIPNLDRQENVGEGYYHPIDVTVLAPSGESLQCRTYQMDKKFKSGSSPSPQYLDVIVRGAVQNKLPTEYIEKLKAVENNGYSGECQLYDKALQLEKDFQN